MNDLIMAGGLGAVAVMQGIILAKLSKIDAVSEKANKVEQWAFGPNGDNGADSDIKTLLTGFRNLDRRMGPPDRRTT